MCVNAQFCCDVAPASESCRLARADRHGSLVVTCVVWVSLCLALIEAYYDLWVQEGFIDVDDYVQNLNQRDSHLGVASMRMSGGHVAGRGF